MARMQFGLAFLSRLPGCVELLEAGHKVEPAVILRGEYFKVLDSVVESVSVLVMHMLPSLKFPSQVGFHERAMKFPSVSLDVLALVL